MKLALATALTMGLACSAAAVAADFDGSVPLTCTPSAGHDCVPGSEQCSKLQRESKGPVEVRVDFAAVSDCLRDMGPSFRHRPEVR